MAVVYLRFESFYIVDGKKSRKWACLRGKSVKRSCGGGANAAQATGAREQAEVVGQTRCLSVFETLTKVRGQL